MRFWYINKSYIDFLRTNATDRIMHWDDPKYKYPKYCLGTLLKINEFNYFAPISSIKDGQLEQDNPLFLSDYFERVSFPIEVERSNNEEIVASIKFNYMFPIHHKDLLAVNTDKFLEYGFPTGYKKFVAQQSVFCSKHKTKIREMANNIYEKATSKIDDYDKYCLDFKLLESNFLIWVANHQASSQKIFPVHTPKRL